MRGGNIRTQPVVAKSVRAIEARVVTNCRCQRVTPKVSVKCNRWCNRWCNQIWRLPIGASGPHRPSVLGRFAVERKHRQSIQSRLHVQESRVRVDVRGEFGIAVTHRRLSRSQRDASRAQQRAERSSQSVNVQHSAPVILVSDASGFEVALQNLHQGVWNDKDGRHGQRVVRRSRRV